MRKGNPMPKHPPAQHPEPTPATDETRYLEWIEQLRADVAESVGGVILRGARPVPIGATDGATARPTTSGGSLVGYTLRNTDAGNPATVYLRDGADALAPLVVVVQLAAGESVRDWFGPGGVNLAAGLFVDVAAGAVEGAVYLRGVE